MRVLVALAVTLALCGIPVSGVASSRDATAVRVSAHIATRTSLQVSTDTLEFDLAEGAADAVAVVTYRAGARTRDGGEVLLTVEPAGGVVGPGGAADAETHLSIAAAGGDVLAGGALGGAPRVAGRWSGSGLRSGAIVFRLQGGAAGRYSVPVRFVLSAP